MRLERFSYNIECVSGDLFQAWHDLNGGLHENVNRRHGVNQDLDLPLHEVITKIIVINSGWNFMLIICALCVSDNTKITNRKILCVSI